MDKSFIFIFVLLNTDASPLQVNTFETWPTALCKYLYHFCYQKPIRIKSVFWFISEVYHRFSALSTDFFLLTDLFLKCDSNKSTSPSPIYPYILNNQGNNSQNHIHLSHNTNDNENASV